ncbi:MAG: AAA family ATPase, partial [Candidatus Aenigmatarchaeota archaeon]
MKLSDLVNWNPWWKGLASAYESWYKYYNFSFIAFKGDLDFSKNYIIRGPRQVGKTYFLFKMMNNAVNNNVASFQGVIYISCDRLGGRNELRNLIRNL